MGSPLQHWHYQGKPTLLFPRPPPCPKSGCHSHGTGGGLEVPPHLLIKVPEKVLVFLEPNGCHYQLVPSVATQIPKYALGSPTPWVPSTISFTSHSPAPALPSAPHLLTLGQTTPTTAHLPLFNRPHSPSFPSAVPILNRKSLKVHVSLTWKRSLMLSHNMHPGQVLSNYWTFACASLTA